MSGPHSIVGAALLLFVEHGGRSVDAIRNESDASLLKRAAASDHLAVEELFSRHRNQLTRMVAVRMDDRLSARLDPSDVVQEALATAAHQLPDYFQHPQVSFYPWLRQIAWNRLIDLHRRHVLSEKRSVTLEERLGVSDSSAMQLAERFLTSSSGPLSQVIRKELCLRVKNTLAQLQESDQEILFLRHLEQLNLRECSEVLEISHEAAKKRYIRAVRRLRRLLDQEPHGAQPTGGGQHDD